MSYIHYISPKIFPIQGVIIFLHELDGNGSKCGIFLQNLQRKLPNFRIIHPDACFRYVDILGKNARAWFNFTGYPTLGNLSGADETIDFLDNLINLEIKAGIPEYKIFLSGFDQGAAMCLLYSMKTNKKIGGYFAINGFPPMISSLSPVPHFVYHSDNNDVIPLALVEKDYASIDLKVNVITGNSHNISEKELNLMSDEIEKLYL